MKRATLCLAVLILACFALAQDDRRDRSVNEIGHSFTYLGQLQQNGGPYTGLADVQFSLWDREIGGARVAPVVTRTRIEVRGGVFRAPVSFPDSAFHGEVRWLEVAVRAPSGDGAYVILTPRRRVTAVGGMDGGVSLSGDGMIELYAAGDRIINATDHILLNIDSDNDQTDRALVISTNRSGDAGGTEILRVEENGRVGIGTSSPNYPLHVETAAARLIYAANLSTSGPTYGGRFENFSPEGTGVYGLAVASTGTNYGVRGHTNNPNGYAGYFTGGRNYFGGRVGIGTASPAAGLHVDAAGFPGAFLFLNANTAGGDSGLRFNREGSVQWHVFNSAADSDLFSIRNAGFAAVLVATQEGKVGIGTSSPDHQLQVETGGERAIHARNTARSGVNIGVSGQSESPDGVGVLGSASASTGIPIGVSGQCSSPSGIGVAGVALASTGESNGVLGFSNSTRGFDFYAAGPGADYGSSSSLRWKRNVVNIDEPLDKLSKLRGVYFDWDEEHGGHHNVGMIAEEVGEVLPEIVNYEENGIDAIGMDYSRLTPLLVEAVNVLRAQKDTQIAKLRQENDDLRARLAALESLVSQLAAESK